MINKIKFNCFCLVLSWIYLIHRSDGKTKNEKQAPMSVRNQLIEDLLVGYHPHSLPLKNVSQKLVVHVRSQLYQIIDVSMASNTIKLTAGLSMHWQDNYLKWDPEDYEGMTSVYMPAKKAWTPDLTLYYSVTKTMSRIYTNDNEVLVQHDGTVEAAVAFTALTMCQYNVKKFPFDRQNCNIVFGSFTHTTATMDIEPYGKVGQKNFFDHQEWELRNTSLIKDYITYYDRSGSLLTTGVAKLNVKIERQPFYYIFILVIPALIITLVAIIGFHIPNTANQSRSSKVQLGLVTLLSMTVLLVGVSKELPKFAISSEDGNRGSFSSVPLLGIFYVILLFVILLNVITNSMLISLERFVVTHGRYPGWMTSCLGIVAKMMPSSSKRKSQLLPEFDDDNHEMKNATETAPNHSSISHESPSLYPDVRGRQDNNVDNDCRIQLDILERLDKTTMSMDAFVAAIVNKELDSSGDKTGKAKDVHLLTERIERILFAFYIALLLVIALLFFCHEWY